MRASALTAACLLVGLLGRVGAAPPEEAAGADAPDQAQAVGIEPVSVRDPLYRLEFQLPAPYWEHYTRKDIEANAPGGCNPQRVPADLLFFIRHKDAAVQGRIELGLDGFLMRNKADMETYIKTFESAILGKARGAVEPESRYLQQQNPIVHQLSFKEPIRTGGGCAGQDEDPGPVQYSRSVTLHYFVRPDGLDAMFYKVLIVAPEETYRQIKGEIDFILSSLHYDGALDAEFFVADAPEDKLLTAKDAERSAKGGKQSNWPMMLMMAAMVFFLFRRRKKKKEEEA